MFCLCGLYLGGCRGNTPANAPRLQQLPTTYGPRGASDEIVAKVNGMPIYQSDVKRQAEVEGVPAQQALESLVAIEALAGRAASQPWGQGKEAHEGFRQILAQAWVVKHIEPQLGPDAIPEQVLQQAYERTRNGFVHPRLLRTALLEFQLPAKADVQRRAQVRGWMNELKPWLSRPENRTYEAWQSLSQEPLWKDRQISFGVTWVPEGEAYSEPLNRAIHALQNPKEVSPIVEDPFGVHVALYLGERAATNVGFDEAKATLRQAIHESWRQRRFLELTNALARKAGVQMVATAEVPFK